MYFIIFQPKDMLKICLNFNEFQPIYVYKRYAYKKECMAAFQNTLRYMNEVKFIFLVLFFVGFFSDIQGHPSIFDFWLII